MEYNIIYSKRKTVSIKVLDDGSISVRAPKGVPKKQIDEIVSRHSRWIENARERALKKATLYNESDCSKEKALAAVMPYVEKYSRLMGVEPKEIKITSAKKRFGSCSSGGTVCFSKYLCLYPESAIEYVVVHELSHLVHLNHSKSFHALVAKYLPDWTERKKLLRILQ